MFVGIYRTVLFYVILMVGVRLMGKRQIGQLEPSEFVVTMMVANLATIPMENTDLPIHSGLVPIATILTLEWLFSALTLRSLRLRALFCGKPVILIENGNLLQKNLRKARITLDELTGHLREKDVLDLRSVQYAILETNGNLSVFPFPDARPATAGEANIQTQPQHLPITLISDGRLMTNNLKKSGKDRAWLDRTLRKKKADIQSTWLLTVDGGGNVVFYPKDRQ